MTMPNSSESIADRNLLFGILAVQMDFISRDALIEAMNAWVLDKSKSLSQILEEQGRLAVERRDLLEAMVAEHLRAHANDPQKSLASVSASSSHLQDLAQISDADVQASVSIVTASEITTDHHTVSYSPAGVTAPSHRYRILRPHAKGGLGEVSIARDAELNREVALKEIRPEHAGNAGSRSRFLLEAEITGGLEHPGIVPVYGLGQYEDGRPFYAMRFIKGDNLNEAIKRYHRRSKNAKPPGKASNSRARSLEFRALLGRFVDVCNAVAYAHSRGILHRDLKPGNIMLGKYGETLVVDWGLAKPHDKSDAEIPSEETPLQPSSSDSDLAGTRMGTALGTPGYMSPEQAAGRLDLLGSASDIYSLGATFYTVLTGQSPFQGKDKGRILQQVQSGNFSLPRQISIDVPAPLEAICLRAMSLRPEDRYATALDMAEDVEHWLADEPVSAWREPATVKMGRWVRNHRPIVAGAAAALLVGIIALGVTAMLLKSANDDLLAANLQTKKEAERARTAEAAARKAEGNAKTEASKAKAVSDFLAKDLLAKVDPEVIPYQEKATVIQLLDQAATKIAGDTSLRTQPLVEAELQDTIGEMYRKLGQNKKSETHLRRAADLYAKVLDPEHPDTLSARHRLARARKDNGKIKLALADVNEIREIALRRLTIKELLTRSILVTHATILQDLGKWDEAEAAFRKVLAAEKDLSGEDSEDYQSTESVYALFLSLTDRDRKKALGIFRRQYAAAVKKHGAEHPTTLLVLNNLAVTLQGAELFEEAEQRCRECLKTRQRVLPPDHPHTIASKLILAQILANRFKVVNNEAEGLLREALAHSKRHLGETHDITCATRTVLGELLRKTSKNLPEAEKLQRSNFEIQTAARGSEYPKTLVALNNLILVLIDVGKFTEADQLSKKLLKIRERILPTGHPHLVTTYVIRAQILQAQQQFSKAESLLRTALADGEKSLGKEHTITGVARNMLAEMLRSQNKNLQEAERLHRLNLDIRKRTSGPEHVLTLVSMNNHILVLSARGEKDKAEKMTRELLAIRQRVLPKDHGHTLDTMSILAQMSFRKRNFAEVEKLTRYVIEADRRATLTAAPRHGSCLMLLSVLLFGQKKFSEAEPFIREYFHWCRDVPQGKQNRFNAQGLLRNCLFLGKKYIRAATIPATPGKTFQIDVQCPKAFPFLFVRDVMGKPIAESKTIVRENSSRLFFTARKTSAQEILLVPFETNKDPVSFAVSVREIKEQESVRRWTGDLPPANGQAQKPQQTHTITFPTAVPVRVDLSSADFDALLHVENAAGEKLALDNNGGDGNNARLFFVPEPKSEYRFAVSSVKPDQHGEYSLNITKYEYQSPTKISEGKLHAGSLTESDPLDSFVMTKKSHSKGYPIEFDAGKSYLVNLQGSFDTFLRIEDDKKNSLQFNDDVVLARRLNSRLVFSPKSKGKCRVVVTSFEPKGGRGDYFLAIQEIKKAAKPTVIEDKLTKSDQPLHKSPFFKGRFHKLHKVPFQAGVTYTLMLECKGFDAALLLVDTTSGGPLAGSKGISPSPETCTMEFTSPINGEFTVVVSSQRKGKTGEYALTVQRFSTVVDREEK